MSAGPPASAASDRSLPIWSVADFLREHLQQVGCLVLSAPTGSGKTTQVPRILLESQECGELPPGQIWICQPRRIAARLVAARVAEELGEAAGERVGYQTRFESRYGPHTRVLFLTEGLLLRRLAENPRLEGVAAVALDEFHERSTALDLTVALLHRLRSSGRSDLRLMVMSATLAMDELASYLGAAVLEVHGRTFPVEIQHVQAPSGLPIWKQAADALDRLLEAVARGTRDDPGDALIFMPGVSDIQRTLEQCRQLSEVRSGRALLLPLHGQLPLEDQDRAIRPDRRGRRRIIVSTNVAETSLTIDGIGLVIDSGLARLDRVVRQGTLAFSQISVERISRASADQRAGRAGRTRPGVCLRLWTRNDHFDRPERTLPQIHRADPAETLMLLRSAGIQEAATSFSWFDAPQIEALQDAEERLSRWGLTTGRALSPLGQVAARLPLPPALATLVARACELGENIAAHAIGWATLLAGSPITSRQVFDPRRAAIATDLPPRTLPSDLALLNHLLQWSKEQRFADGSLHRLGLTPLRCEETWRSADQLARLLKVSLSACRLPLPEASERKLMNLLISLLPDRLAVLRPGPDRSVALPGLRDTALDPTSGVDQPGPIFAGSVLRLGANASHRNGDIQLGLAVALDPHWLQSAFPERFKEERSLCWDDQRRAVLAETRETLDGTPVRRHTAPPCASEREAASALLGEHLAQRPQLHPDWHPGSAAMQWIARCRFTAHHFPQEQPVTFDPTDLAVLLAELAGGCTSVEQVARRPLLAAIKEGLSWQQQQAVERLAPTRLPLEAYDRRGQRAFLPLRYDEEQPENPPTGQARIQEFFSFRGHPTVAGGRVAVLLEILGPNHRPVQRTSDLPGFWERLYPSVRAELKRRYPRHDWRENPLT